MLHRLRSARVYLSLGTLVAVGAVAVAVLGSSGGVASASPDRNVLAHVSNRLASSSSAIPARMSCAALATDPNFVTIPRHPTSIASATVVAASTANGNPEYCDVQGMIAPQIHFDLKLPTRSWQGRYLQNGCGGYCGSVGTQTFPSCDATLGGDFAMATDDEGHQSENGLGGAGLFAFNSQRLRDDYGYLSEHALAVVSKTIITAFYGRGPSHSYYDGCSDGGREAMEEAERYPTDFNGIIAGAPEIIAGPLNAESQTWDYAVNTDSQGNAILTDDKLPALHAAVIRACGGDDGTDDGIITDPRSCHFDPASIQCAPGTDTDSCLTPAQVTVVRRFYQGPADPRGRLLYPGGLPYGSELGWSAFELPPSANGGTVPTTQSLDYAGLSLPYLRYQLLAPGRLGPDPSRWQFTDRYFQKMFPAANTWDAMSTDLRAFRAHGGKLIIWQGWSDNGIPPDGTVDYYEDLEKSFGGLASTQRFARLFMFPGEYHCGPGYTNSSFDLVYPMVQWVEGGSAPSRVVAADTVDGTSLTRPVYPYPDIPRYRGSGDPDTAASFRPVRSPDADQYVDWYGDHLFHEPISRGADGSGGASGFTGPRPHRR